MEVMDVTLRDGSYAVNFQFSKSETQNICTGLGEAGIKYVEIGHGLGLRANSPEYGVAACSDWEYIDAAKSASNEIKIGVFCIPGIAEVNDVTESAKHGCSFIRVGTNVENVEMSQPYIEAAKECGLEVMANYMKSYTATETEFAEKVRKSMLYGADVVYIVDSAGGMYSEDIQKYIHVIREISNLKIGFHGHDNLGLAVANTLFAYEHGVDYVDCSLGGLGRSSGNAVLEKVIANLYKKHGCRQYDLKKIARLGQKYIFPYLRSSENEIDLYCGLADFHSSYLKYIQEQSNKYSVDALDLIVEYSKFDKVNLDEKKLEEIALELKKNDRIDWNYDFKKYIGNEQKVIAHK